MHPQVRLVFPRASRYIWTNRTTASQFLPVFTDAVFKTTMATLKPNKNKENYKNPRD